MIVLAPSLSLVVVDGFAAQFQRAGRSVRDDVESVGGRANVHANGV